jgi:hypothetical protein
MIELIETPALTRQVSEQLNDADYRALQLYLIVRPDAGPVISRSGGLRKLRWRLAGRGKRGGVRVIDYWKTVAGRIYLLFMYPRNVRAELSERELQVLRRLVDD